MKEEDVLFHVLLRVWPAVTLSGAGLPLSPAASVESVITDLCSRYVSGLPIGSGADSSASAMAALSDATHAFKAYDPVELCF
jgi:hypothetical protein